MNDQETADAPGEHPAEQTGPVTSAAVRYAHIGRTNPARAQAAIMSQLAAPHEYTALHADSRTDFVTDMGQSANSTTRPGLHRLLACADAGTLRRCYITNRAALARNHALLTTLLDRFDASGVTITFLKDHPERLEYLDA